MRAGRGRRYWHWLECFWCWQNWYNLDLEVNPASAETGTYVSELTWDQCPAGWLQSRHLYADRCQPPRVQPMPCHFLKRLGWWRYLCFKWSVLCKPPVYQWRLWNSLVKQTFMRQHKSLLLIIRKIFILIVEIILSLSKDLVEIMLNTTLWGSKRVALCPPTAVMRTE